MGILVLDVETTTKNKGSPFTKDNKLCQVGLLTDSTYSIYNIEYSEAPYGNYLKEIQEQVSDSSLLVGFNIKFDLHWLRRYGISFSDKRTWDCQIAHFLITNQQAKYPSLDGVAEYYNLGKKIDKIKEYWDDGIDTPDIPYEELSDYLKQDLNLTYKIYLKQKEYFTSHPELYRLFFLEMLDLPILQEMEFNGMRFDKEQAIELSKTTIDTMESLFSKYNFSIPLSFTSGDHLSALLYGGSIKEKYRESYVFQYKDGRQTEKERWSVKEHILPQLIKPLPKSELKKEGMYAVDKVTLQQLMKKRSSKEVKQLLEDIIEYGDLAHLNGTYFEGLPKQMDLHGDEKYIHGQFNQVVAVTGRLSSSKPNLQNRDRRIDHCFISRYD